MAVPWRCPAPLLLAQLILCSNFFDGVIASTASSASVANPSLARLSKVETSIMGESALIDKETGRIFWEGGTSSTLSASVAPKLRDQLGIYHFKASLLTGILLLAAVGALASWIRQMLQSSAEQPSRTFLSSAGKFLVNWTILWVPSFDRWFVIAMLILYFIESYTCSTRRYLANAISSPDGVESYIEKIREARPNLEWKVRSFHYEQPFWLTPWQATQQMWRNFGRQHADSDVGGAHQFTSTAMRRKRVTHYATGTYEFGNCVDKTIAGVWRRAIATSSATAPFTKIVFSKLLVLSNPEAREAYFKQQSEFVTEHCQGDEYAEFSTHIQIDGFKPRLLAVRSSGGSARFFRHHLFWLFTALGLTVPYRIWFSNHCDEIRVTVIKETSANVPVAQSKSWFSPKKEKKEPENSEELDFRSLMQSLQLYAEQDGTTEEQQNATNAVMEDVEAAILLTPEVDTTNTTASDGNLTSLAEDTRPLEDDMINGTTLHGNTSTANV